ncbi:TIGR03758 family integrating conjugative element protein [Pseudomonas edaphica]|uniref:TIGR03758 family integrating conjugative element protein n=1 Tax=Pseudomonas edaphica TaxID=2006980 RepID=A0ABY2U535_9PSED|nr:TIGR03758 family integrating conjugative element protein [Pseudomonas edaphica]TLG91331.1 TIGR03758 family integrating conjugative element protein [Pseudomonas edaphica]
MSSAQLTAFQAGAGFSPSDLAWLLLAGLFALLLLWSAWALNTSYAGWAEQRLSQRQFFAVAVRVFALYLALTFFLLS